MKIHLNMDRVSVNTNIHKRNSRSHGAVMHTWSSLWAPRQGRPLPERWGLEQNRYRDWRPAPHDTEHWPQGVHTDHWPSTGGCVFVCGGIEQEKYSTAWDNEVKENSYWWFFIACLYLFLLFSYLHIFINLIHFMYGFLCIFLLHVIHITFFLFCITTSYFSTIRVIYIGCYSDQFIKLEKLRQDMNYRWCRK